MALLHLDVFFLSGFWVQLLVLQPSSLLMAVNVLGLLSMIPALVPAAISVRRESKGLAITATCFLILEMAFLAGRIAMLSVYRIAAPYDTFADRIMGYGITAALLLLATSIIAAICWSNFNKGLKSRLQLATLSRGDYQAAGDTAHHSLDQRLLNDRMQLD